MGWFDLEIADVKVQKKLWLYVVLSIVLGGMAGAMYVLILNAIRKRKEGLPKHKKPFNRLFTNVLILVVFMVTLLMVDFLERKFFYV